jgi:hypothetical protein
MLPVLIELLLNILILRKGKTPTAVVVALIAVIFGVAVVTIIRNTVVV